MAETSTIFNISQIEARPLLQITAKPISTATQRHHSLSKVHHYVLALKRGSQTETLSQRQQHELTIEGDCILWGTLLQEYHCDHPGGSLIKSLARSFIW